ncbi:hypothetical protein D7Y11_05335 [Corallococcus sp. AB018]|uniref:hypothetical protein n=1 Tax=unclassified Corallococcus TaxID=2685029 RepID=UPI000EDDAEB2|nr:MULTISPECIES: hypothetical protein [unclassified Corallococcus]RKI04114.1 hypothetical protein D7Y04_03975 [Corallococcus sp. AB038B]RUO94283.1 hypothetical protein D7Y11_05335 [Corallococcus sp. AB018]
MNSRLAVFAALLSCVVAFLASALAGMRGAGSAFVLALLPVLVLMGLMIEVRQRVTHWRRMGYFALYQGVWWGGSIVGGLLMAVWAVMLTFAYFSTPGVCSRGECAVVIFYVPVAFVAGLPLGMLVASAALAAVGMVKGLKPVAVQGVLAGTAAFAFVLFLILGR